MEAGEYAAQIEERLMFSERGKFVVLEGQGFTGKTEQSPLLSARLSQMGFKVWETQEPGGVPSAIRIRAEILEKRGNGLLTAEEETILFYQSREKFLKYGVRPALRGSKWVVSTRFSASTRVYQGDEGGVSLELLDQLERKVVKDTQPDLYLLLDVPAEEVYRRLTAKTHRLVHGFNERDMDKIRRRRESYLKIATDNQYGNWRIVNAVGTIPEVHETIWREVVDKFRFSQEVSFNGSRS